ncbi:hypothetical protein LMG23992_00533 [Cupriavidus laharis]|uniref:FAD:protein FMN transferase n=1 Tax=Cupriavidus laharis TaxID=151654 RepID=A0ABM8WE19_9BURK|nr:FAD:protein FMN transferase [Cupriavidus laharis]CAG9165575.1 hypothetical protein LMG23992_00533 [Cupriavidus laharis]
MPKPRIIDAGRRRSLRGLGGLSLLATGMFVRPALADPAVHRASQQLMGTRVDIVVQCASAAVARDGMAAAFAEMTRLEQRMSRYRPDSEVSELQRCAGRRAVRVSPELIAVLRTAGQLSARSSGAFDVTVGAYAGWQFEAPGTHVPDAGELARERPLVDYRQVILDETRGEVLLHRPGMRLDLGGIAKLPILDAGMQALQRHGLRDAMINGGGDVLASGQLQGRDWRVGVRDPRAPERLLGVLSVSNGVVASSGDYERCFFRNGRRYHHVLDPRTGMPADGPHGVTLVAPDIETINGLGAAIMVAGEAAGRKLLAPLRGVDALIAGAGAPWMSDGMARRLRAVQPSAVS